MLNVLLVEDHPPTARLIETLLDGAADYDFAISWAESLSDVERLLLGEKRFDVALCDLGLPDSQGIETLDRMLELVPQTPVIVLTGLDDEEVALKAVRHGAQDFLIKGEFDTAHLKRSILYGVERRRVIARMGAGGRVMEGVLNSSRDAVMALKALREDGKIVDFRWTLANPACERVLGLHARELLGQTLNERLDQPAGKVMLDGFTDAVENDEPFDSELPIDRGGGDAWIHVSAVKMEDGVAVTVADITERIRATLAIQAREERLRRIMETVVDGIVILDEQGRVENVNPAAEAIFGWSDAELAGQHVGAIIPDFMDDAGRINGHVIVEGDEGPLGSIREYHALSSAGRDFPLEAAIGEMHLGGRRFTIAVVRDITQRKAAEERLRFLANRDSLTGLANRFMFEQRLEDSLRRARLTGRPVGVLFLDLDLLKNINDTQGHRVGDMVLKETARRLETCIRDGDTAARISGDEFVVILDGIKTDEAAVAVAREILGRIEQPFNIEGKEAFITGSLGVVISPDHGADTDTLLKNVDTALHQAKHMGRNRYQVYDETLGASLLRRKAIEDGLRRAMDKGELSLAYQPKIDLTTLRVTGAEALLRWNSEELGQVSPAEFVPVAEETGQIGAIGAWVLTEACRQTRAWAKEGYPPVRVAVNLSGRQFRDAELTRRIMGVLTDTGLDPQMLELELTESILIENADEAIKTLYALKGIGIRVSVDDFGTGYSSLSYLKRFPIDTLKIDRSFVKDTPDNADDVAIVRAICSLAKSLDLRIVAEGVETKEQADFLRDIGDIAAQGFYYARPVPAEDFPGTCRKITDGRPKLTVLK